MIRVYTAQTMPMVAHVQNVLEAEGIRCVLRNEFLGAGAGGIPPVECWPELWIVEDEHEERARSLVQETTHRSEAELGDHWKCPACQKDVEPILDRCWNCQAPRPE